MTGQQTYSPLGQIPEDWQLVRLGDVTTKIGSGATPRGGESAYLAERTNYALIRSQNVYDYRFDEEGFAFISDEQAKELANAEVRRGDVLLNITGDGVTFGRVCLVPEGILPACVNQHVSIIRANPAIIDPRYLVAYLAHPAIKAYIESFNAGGSRRAITKGHIESFEIPLPPLEQQKRIASMLAAIQRKIDLNRDMDNTLEEIERAIFRSWFVDFDPVRAKNEGRDTGLNTDLEVMFPSTFVDSEAGSVPVGWRAEPLDTVANFLNGLALQQFPPNGLNDLPVIKIAELRKRSTLGADLANSFVPDDYVVQDGDVLFLGLVVSKSCSGMVARVRLISTSLKSVLRNIQNGFTTRGLKNGSRNSRE